MLPNVYASMIKFDTACWHRNDAAQSCDAATDTPAFKLCEYSHKACAKPQMQLCLPSQCKTSLWHQQQREKSQHCRHSTLSPLPGRFSAALNSPSTHSFATLLLYVNPSPCRRDSPVSIIIPCRVSPVQPFRRSSVSWMRWPIAAKHTMPPNLRQLPSRMPLKSRCRSCLRLHASALAAISVTPSALSCRASHVSLVSAVRASASPGSSSEPSAMCRCCSHVRLAKLAHAATGSLPTAFSCNSSLVRLVAADKPDRMAEASSLVGSLCHGLQNVQLWQPCPHRRCGSCSSSIIVSEC
ncbi:hypothetical protein COO60DRAFT_302771 [Scenedesmus sp. NREL 46B-D3]|nr:hypothetical protein COO60DRAFT_302771 [Scenedesmus sp. NREL 46B-D3]